MKNTIKTNCETLLDEVAYMSNVLLTAAVKLFGDEIEVSQFYYGERLNMVDIYTKDGYGHFNVTSRRVSLCGLTAKTNEFYHGLCLLTYRDECYEGDLFQIAGLNPITK